MQNAECKMQNGKRKAKNGKQKTFLIDYRERHNKLVAHPSKGRNARPQ